MQFILVPTGEASLYIGDYTCHGTFSSYESSEEARKNLDESYAKFKTVRLANGLALLQAQKEARSVLHPSPEV